MPIPEGSSVGRDASGDLDGSVVGRAAAPPGREGDPAVRPRTAAGLPEDDVPARTSPGAPPACWRPACSPTTFGRIRRYWQRGELNVRTSVMMSIDVSLSLPDLLDSIRAWGVYSGMGDDLLRVGGIKMHVDGGIEGALLREPYAIDPTTMASTQRRARRLKAVTLLAAELGWNVGVHACGGGAMDVLLEIYEEVDREIPLAAGASGCCTASIRPRTTSRRSSAWVWSSRSSSRCSTTWRPNFIKFWGRERTEHAIPLREYLDHGIRVGRRHRRHAVPDAAGDLEQRHAWDARRRHRRPGARDHPRRGDPHAHPGQRLRDLRGAGEGLAGGRASWRT